MEQAYLLKLIGLLKRAPVSGQPAERIVVEALLAKYRSQLS